MKRRGFWWWITAVFAPLGILAGPIGIASMFAGLIEWHGPIGYAVEIWSSDIRPPFDVVFTAVASFLNIPAPSKFIVDYLILGFVFSFSLFRSFQLEDPEWLLRRDTGDGPDQLFFVAFALFALAVVVVWILALMLLLGGMNRVTKEYIHLKMERQQIGQGNREWTGYNHRWLTHCEDTIRSQALVVMPFILFLLLWGLNYLL